jgi:MYXO-CTERM domain-containing protein
VVDDVRNDFGSFYRTLFAETVALHPGAAVTEYSWDASTCDPCPGPTLNGEDFATLGADVMDVDPWANWVLTRMHLRYSSDTLGDDLVFAEAGPIVGGRERYNNNEIEVGSTPSSYNNFQGRYIIRHAWTEPVTCEDPVYGRWGGPNGAEFPGQPQGATSPNTSGDSATSGGGGGEETSLPSDELSDLVAQDIPEINVEASGRFTGEGDGEGNDMESEAQDGCSCQTTDPLSLALLGFFGVWVMLRRRRLSRT